MIRKRVNLTCRLLNWCTDSNGNAKQSQNGREHEYIAHKLFTAMFLGSVMIICGYIAKSLEDSIETRTTI